jgi:UV excision repair protein RAD23
VSEKARDDAKKMKIHLKTLCVFIHRKHIRFFFFPINNREPIRFFARGFLLFLVADVKSSLSLSLCFSMRRAKCERARRTAQKFDIEVDSPETTTILKCKQVAIEQHPGSLGGTTETDFLVFVHKGKVLEDEKTVAECEITEDGFVVVMSKKTKKPAEKAAPAPEAPAAVPAATATPTPTTASPAPAPAAAPQAAEVPVSSPGLVVGAELEKAIEELQAMGFPRDQCVAALRAAFNNPDRAVEYLLNGIPEGMMAPAPQAAAATAATAAAPGPDAAATNAARTAEGAAASAPGGGAGGAAPATADGSAPLNLFPQGIPGANGGAQEDGQEGEVNTLAFLRDNPQFQAIRAMVQSNPSILQPMLGELQRQNPQLYHLINSNQEEFLQLLNEPSDFEVPGMGEDEMEQIELSTEENEACERLMALGFTMEQCVEAYIACDKNEEMAANYLFEAPPDAMGE